MRRNMNTTGIPLKKNMEAKPADQSHWVLMTTDVIPTSRNKSYAQQQQLVRKYAHYQVPQTLEAATCILMEHVKEAKHLYSDDPWTYTRCQEQTAGSQNAVGGFGPSGLGVFRYYDRDTPRRRCPLEVLRPLTLLRNERENALSSTAEDNYSSGQMKRVFF